MADLITQAEYARRRDVSREAVRKAIATGRITGVLDAGKVKVDPDLADIEWARNTDADQQQRGAPAQFAATQVRAQQAAAPAETLFAPGGSPRLVNAKTDTEVLRKELMELELGEKRRELVSIADVERAYSAKLAAAKDAFEAIPERIAPDLAATSEVAVCQSIVADAIQLAMRHLLQVAEPAT